MSDRSISFPIFAPARAFRFAEVWARVGAMRQARQTRRLLGEMDARMLADIGVARGDAMIEASRPMWDLTPRR